MRPLVGELDPTCHNQRSERQKERRKKGRQKWQRCLPNMTRSTGSPETTGRDDPQGFQGLQRSYSAINKTEREDGVLKEPNPESAR